MSNLKDILSTILGVLLAIFTAIGGLNIAVLHLPTWITTVAVIGVAICGAIIGVITGKNPNLSSKTPEQVDAQNNGK